MTRVAILHFTSSPLPGGVEGQIDAQCHALRNLGYDVRLIVGAGEAPDGVELARIPSLLPDARSGFDPAGDHPDEGDPRVIELERVVGDALLGCDVCIVHNAFTVYLIPALTRALFRLARRPSPPSWIAWCYDASDASAYWPPVAAESRRPLREPPAALQFVAPSSTTGDALVSLFGLDSEDVSIIRPTIQHDRLLRPGPEAAHIIRRLSLDIADPVVLVPAKLLPHKNLELAVRAGAALRGVARRPAVLFTAPGSPHQPETSARLGYRLKDLIDQLGAADTVHLLSDGRHVLSHEAIRDLMLMADVVLLPSAEEGFGVPLLEAMALRAPILCSDIPAFREVSAASARFFPLSIPAEGLAMLIVKTASEARNRDRKRAVTSWHAYGQALARLLEPAADSSRHADVASSRMVGG